MVIEMESIIGCMEVFLTDGFMYALLALGFYISYSILDFPDLSVEGTVLLGGVSYALLVRAGVNPWLAHFKPLQVAHLYRYNHKDS